ncbi:LOG family protein [Patescibacteria group bacterium]
MKKTAHSKFKIIHKVAFFGDAAVPPDSDVYKNAFDAAKLLGEQGFVTVNGGGPGVMEAATKGAESVGGETVTVTFYPKYATGFEGKYVGNVADKEVVTNDYIERMFTLMAESDMFLIFKGGTGTVSEFGTAWVLGKLYYGHHKPFILVGSFWRPIVYAMQENLLLDEKEMDVFEVVDDVDGLLPAIEHLEWKMQQADHTHCKVCAEHAFMN